jgi:hypothetical protein
MSNCPMTSYRLQSAMTAGLVADYVFMVDASLTGVSTVNASLLETHSHRKRLNTLSLSSDRKNGALTACWHALA